MRDIKFRGIKKETKGEWLYGGYFSNTDEEGLEHFIFEVYNGGNPVYDHTIGQFTGLKDKNEVDIYEGDILENGWVISFKDGMFGVFDKNNYMGFNTYMSKFREVVGNIYETP